MASNSHRRSDSSARSSRRKTVHVGTGTTSRKASIQPHTQLEVKGKTSRREGDPSRVPQRPTATNGARERDRKSTPPRSGRPISAKQAERKKRQAERRRALQLRVLVVVGAVLALGGTWVAVSGSQLFEIKDIEVVGNTRLSADEVIALAELDSDETLLRVDSQEVKVRLSANPWIADVDLSRRIPSTLRIEVKERVPAAVVDTGTTFWFVESSGRVLAESVASSATVVPVIRDVPDFIAEPGIESESAALRNALRVLGGLTDELRASVRTVSAPLVSETALLTATGVEIMVGEAVNMEEKSVLITDILAAQGGGVVFIDVRSIERPISRGLGE